MALDLEDKPGYQNDGLDKKPGNDGEHDDLGVRPEHREAEVADLEDAFNSPSAEKPDTPASSPEELKTQEEKGGSPQGSDQIGEGYKGDDQPGGVRKLASKFSGISPTKKLLGGGILGIATTFIVAFLSLLPGELIHIKEVALQEIGGVQSNVYRVGRRRLYSTMFFFDKDSRDFDGYKATNLRRLMGENRQTKKLVKAMRNNGFEIEFEKTNAGRPTGRIKRVSYQNGPNSFVAESQAELERAWDIKKNPEIAAKFKGALEEVVPDKSARWYGKTARKLYRRWGLTRTNWLSDKAKKFTGIEALERAELRLRKKLREKLFGSSGSSSASARLTAEEEQQMRDDGATDEEIAQRNAGLNTDMDGVSDSANDHRNKIDGDINATNASELGDVDMSKTVREAAVEAGEESIKKAPQSLVKAVKVTGAVETACEIRTVLGTIEKGARFARAYQLMQFALAILTIADGQKMGKISSGEMSEMMSYINKPGDDGSTFFSSGGWQYYTGNNKGSALVNKGSRDKYAVGGGFTGTLGEVNDWINTAGASRGTCKTVSNPFVQLGSIGTGIFLGFGSGGSSIVVNATLVFGATMVKNVAVNIGTQLLIPMIAGTVIDGAEKGMATGDAFTSGFEVLNSANAANTGMYPLSKTEYSVLKSDYEQERQREFASLPLKQRLFSTTNSRSLAFSFANSTASFSFANLASQIGGSFRSLASIFMPPKIVSAQNDSQCLDSDMNDHNLAATPFCNYIVGIPESTLNDPNMSPDKVDQRMFDEGHVDSQGNAISDSYKDYLEQCTSEDSESRSIDIIHKGDGTGVDQYSDFCSKNKLFNVYRLYEGMVETDNEILTDSPSTGGSDTTQTEAGDPPNLGPDLGGGYYKMPEATSGEYVFSPNTPDDERCGSKQLINVIYNVSKRWYAKYPNSKIRIGDLNAAAGHASHMNGVDVDITVVDQSAANTSGDANKSKELGKMFADTDVIKLIFYNDTSVQNDFNSYAQSKGLSSKMQYWSNHADHFHVRIADQFRLSSLGGCSEL